MKIYLDDTRPAPDASWTLVKTSGEAIGLLQKEEVKEISLDHDLGEESVAGTGYDVIKWIEEITHNDPYYLPPIIHIHTANPVAFKRMDMARISILLILSNRAD